MKVKRFQMTVLAKCMYETSILVPADWTEEQALEFARKRASQTELPVNYDIDFVDEMELDEDLCELSDFTVPGEDYPDELKDLQDAMFCDRFDNLKIELFKAGTDAIEDFLGYELNPEESEDIIDNRMDDVYIMMPKEEMETYFSKYGV